MEICLTDNPDDEFINSSMNDSKTRILQVFLELSGIRNEPKNRNASLMMQYLGYKT